jgi:hypothetical protein
VAVNCWVEPCTKDGFDGDTAREERLAEVTVSTVEPEIPETVAATAVVPAANPVASP